MNPRIETIDLETTSRSTQATLAEVKEALGMVPNLHRVVAHSPAALAAYMQFGAALAEGVITPELAERIAIATSAANSCQYCASAHTLIGSSVGIEASELESALIFDSRDEKTAAVLAFVEKLVERRGQLSDAEFDRLRASGHDEAAIVEIIAHVAMTTFTNLINNALRTEIDLPVVPLAAKNN